MFLTNFRSKSQANIPKLKLFLRNRPEQLRQSKKSFKNFLSNFEPKLRQENVEEWKMDNVLRAFWMHSMSTPMCNVSFSQNFSFWKQEPGRLVFCSGSTSGIAVCNFLIARNFFRPKYYLLPK